MLVRFKFFIVDPHTSVGGTFGRGLFYGVIAGFSAAMITEIFDQQYQRMTKPASELRPSSLLAVPNDPFAKRSKEFE